jgi:hypothetical protein
MVAESRCRLRSHMSPGALAAFVALILFLLVENSVEFRRESGESKALCKYSIVDSVA